MKLSKEQRLAIFKRAGYEPTPEQVGTMLWRKRYEIHFSDLEDKLNKIKLLAGGEQASKSTSSAMEVVSRALEGQLYWLCGVDYSIPRKEFEYIWEAVKKIPLLKPESVVYHQDVHSECALELITGQRIITKSFKDIEKAMTKESPDGILICEAAQVEWGDIERCLSRLGASGGWLLLSGTFEGSVGWYAEKFKEWQAPNKAQARSFSIPSWENFYVYPGGREDPKIKYLEENLLEETFMERLGAVPCPISRLVVPEFRTEIHVGEYNFDPDLDVELAIDPGRAGAYAVEVVQWRGDTVYIIDEVYKRGLITNDIIEICQLELWWKNVRRGAIDVAAKAQITSGEQPDSQIWLGKARLGLRMNRIEEEPGIDRLRTFMKPHPVTKKPQLFINYICRGIISELGGGKSPVDGGGAWLRDKNTLKPIPRNNHALKAMIYLLIDRFGYVTVTKKNKMKVFYY